MRTIIHELKMTISPETLMRFLDHQAGLFLLRSSYFDSDLARYSVICSCPFLIFRSFGARCELLSQDGNSIHYGNPWSILNNLMARYEIIDEVDFPLPLGACVGYWGYDLRHFQEPNLTRNSVNDLELPDCYLGFFDNLMLIDHRLEKTWIISTGLRVDGSRDIQYAKMQVKNWLNLLSEIPDTSAPGLVFARSLELQQQQIFSNLSHNDFVERIQKAQDYIQQGDIYQVNLSHRLTIPCSASAWQVFQNLLTVSPAPFSAFLHCGDFQLASASPELFLHLSGHQILSRPIKGTRPRSSAPDRDAQLTYELQTSSKEAAELIMITDLLRNDFGRVCEYGSIHVPELLKLEKYPQVQHLVSSIKGNLRPQLSHLDALASCFPGGSITGAPKIRAMDIIDELEPTTRGPYTGCLGYLGFNRESQLSIIIRNAICFRNTVFFQVGAGIVYDSDPIKEYQETITKAAGILIALQQPHSQRRFPRKRWSAELLA
jgi:para-aminobenzoate synthetase component I